MSNWKEMGAALTKAGLPLLANALVPGSGVVVAALGSAMGLSNATPDAITTALAADPTALEKAREFEATHQETLLKLALDRQELENTDRASARAREMTMKDKTPMILAFVITGGFFGTIAALLLAPLPASAHDYLMILLGTLQAAFIGCINYYFGSSQSSNRKTELLAAPK